MASSMPRNGGQPSSRSAAAEQQGEGPPVIELADGRRLQAVLPSQTDVEEAEGTQASTDTVHELLAGNYSEDIVNEVRQYGKPQWEQTESSLDPIDDIQDFYDYDFKLPPDVHDAYVAAAQDEIIDLENMKKPVDPAIKAQIEQRRQLVEGRHAEDVRWMKHKAYYRGIQKVRAAKKQLEQILNEDCAEATQGTTPQQHPQQTNSNASSKQQPQQKLSVYSEDEILAAISDPSEWEQGWTDPSYKHHPEVVQQLRSAFAGSLGLPYVSPQEQAERDKQWEQLMAAEAAKQAEQAQLEAAKKAFVAKHTPYQAFTPEYLARQKKQQQLQAHRHHKQQAFWLSLGIAVGSSAVRWWLRKNSKKQQQEQRRRGSQAGNNAGSRRSTRPPTPVLIYPEAIAE